MAKAWLSWFGALAMSAAAGTAEGAAAPMTEAEADAALAGGRCAQAAVARLGLFERTKDPVHLERAARAFLAIGTPAGQREASRILRQYLGLEQEPTKRAEAEQLLAQAEAGLPTSSSVATTATAHGSAVSPTAPAAAPSPTAPPAAAPPSLGRSAGTAYPALPAWAASPAQPSAPVATEMNSPALLGVGIAVTSYGVIAPLAGGFAYMGTASYYECDAGDTACEDEEQSEAAVEIAFIVTGIVGVIAGPILIVVGAAEVPAQGQPAAASLLPEVGVGLGTARLDWRF
jgi:hypothetical protein